VEFLISLKNHDQILESHVNSAFVIKCPITINSVFHEIWYYKIKITKEFCIQYIYLLFVYLPLLFSSVCIKSSD